MGEVGMISGSDNCDIRPVAPLRRSEAIARRQRAHRVTSIRGAVVMSKAVLCAYAESRGVGLRICARFFKWGVVAACFLLSVVPARPEYRVDTGDVIEIFVARVPDLQRRVTVKMDGTISFPLLGTIVVSGLSPSQLQAKIQSILATKVFQQRASDGREVELAIDPDIVTATVVEYRPIYVNGDVSKPGEYPYRPFMTARQAVAMSGGYDLMRARMVNPFFESADLRSEYASLWIELAKLQTRVWRIKTELGDKDNVDPDALLDVPLSRATISQTVKVETEQLAVSQADHQRQKAYLQRSIRQGDEQIAVLSEQQHQEDQGVRSDNEELQKVLELYGKGALPSPRVTDARRAVLLSSTRKLQTTAQLMQMKRQQDDLIRQMEKLDDQRKIDLLRELQEAAGKVGALRAKLQGVTEKLQYATARIAGGNDVKAKIAVIRKGETRIPADEDFELQPGDVVEVALRLDRLEYTAGATATAVTAHRAEQLERPSPAETAVTPAAQASGPDGVHTETGTVAAAGATPLPRSPPRGSRNEK
jgi:polysaccharide biosynthesis/export protein